MPVQILKRLLKKKNIANALTIARISFAPLLIMAGTSENKKLFLIFFTSNTILDAVDGLLARILKIESELGRRLDTIVDNIVILTAVAIFIYISKSDLSVYLDKYSALVILPAVTYLLQIGSGYLFTRKLTSFHFYSAKFAQLPLVLFFIFSLLDKFQPFLLSIAVISFVISNIEGIIIYLLRKSKTDEDMKSVLELFINKSK